MTRFLGFLTTLFVALGATVTHAGLGTTSSGLIYLKEARCRGGSCPVQASRHDYFV